VTAPRAALYARVSTDEQSPDLQVEELRRLAEQRGWRVVDEYVDRGVSGVKESRPALDALLADAQAGKLDLVAVWKLDRLGRSLQHLLRTLDCLTGWGVQFASARDSGIDTTSPSGRLMLHMLAAFAQFERDLLRERVIAGVRRAQAQGKHCGRKPVAIDLRPAVAMLDRGHGIKTTARSLGVSVSTLRRRLREAGEWPRQARLDRGVQNPAAQV
jgi:DNA invertase Pin-like site-specific DNA recombinase